MGALPAVQRGGQGRGHQRQGAHRGRPADAGRRSEDVPHPVGALRQHRHGHAQDEEDQRPRQQPLVVEEQPERVLAQHRPEVLQVPHDEGLQQGEPAQHRQARQQPPGLAPGEAAQPQREQRQHQVEGRLDGQAPDRPQALEADAAERPGRVQVVVVGEGEHLQPDDRVPRLLPVERRQHEHQHQPVGGQDPQRPPPEVPPHVRHAPAVQGGPREGPVEQEPRQGEEDRDPDAAVGQHPPGQAVRGGQPGRPGHVQSDHQQDRDTAQAVQRGQVPRGGRGARGGPRGGLGRHRHLSPFGRSDQSAPFLRLTGTF